MRQVDECKTYELNIPKLTKVNSFVADGRVIFITKKSYEGKPLKMYIAYDSHTKVQLAGHRDKEFLIKYLQSKDMSVLGVDESRLF